MTEIDNFFADFENQYQQKKNLSTNSNMSPQASDSETEIDAFLGDIMDNFSQKKVNSNQVNNQDLFKDIKEHFSESKSSPNGSPKTHQNQDLFSDIQAKFNQNKNTHDHTRKNDNSQKKLDSLFTEVESKFLAQKKEKKQSQLDDSNLREIELKYQVKKEISQENKPLDIAAIKEEELKKQRQKKALVKQAEMWLKKLDPYSDEGFWFEQFSSGYDSKLEAAIDYLEALNTNHF